MLFDLLTYLAQLNMHLYFCDKFFPVTLLLDCVRNSTISWVIYKETIPIIHTYAHYFRSIYLTNITNCFDIFKSLPGVTVSPIHHACDNFGILFLIYFCCYICNNKSSRVKTSPLLCYKPLLNKCLHDTGVL